MILVDANILLYAAHSGAAESAAAAEWLEGRLSGVERVGLPWVVILAFVRLSSSRAMTPHPVSPDTAWRRVEAEWLSKPNVWIPEPGPSHRRILGTLFAGRGLTSRHVTDAHLAALAIEHGLTLCSADGSFANFPGLSWLNPLRPNTMHDRLLPWSALRRQPGQWTGDPLAPVVYSRARTGTPSARKLRR